MQVSSLVLQLFEAGRLSEASIDFKPAFQVARQRVGKNQEQAQEHQSNILLAAQVRQQTSKVSKVLGCDQKFAPFYDQEMLLPLSSAKHRALAV